MTTTTVPSTTVVDTQLAVGRENLRTSNGNAETLDRSSEASLLDSCEDDDDDEMDTTSIQACGSEDYAQFVDETGRQQESTIQVQVSMIDKRTGATIADVPTNRNVSPTPKVNLTTAGVKAEPSSTVRRKVSVSPPQLDGLAFDLNQPWERSLLRQLEKDTPVYETKAMMLLGHTESRDFAMEYDPNNDDNVSLETSSSCPPQKMQFIHRPLYAPPEPRVVYRMESSNDEDDDDNHNVVYHHPHHHQQPMRSPQPHSNNHPNHHHSPSTTSSLTSATFINEDGRDDEHIPIHLPKNAKSNLLHASQQQQQYFLEMEASTVHTASYHEDYDAFTNHDLVYHPPLPDPGCFCLGYNMLEYVLAPPVPRQPVVMNKKRIVGVMRPVRLPRVDESNVVGTTAIDTIPEVIDLSGNKKHAATVLRGKSVEPEGSYFTATENYYTTATEEYTTSRQGVDL
jgi:hypothetical protein